MRNSKNGTVRSWAPVVLGSAALIAGAGVASGGPWAPMQADGGLLYWDVDASAQIDGAYTPMGPDGGVATPVSGQLQVTETVTNYYSNAVKKKQQPQPSNTPDPPGSITTIPIPAWGPNEPANPFGYVPPVEPTTYCADGMGWSFESGSYAGWTGTGLFTPAPGSVVIIPPGPVFGNNVDINRMNPPGFIPDGDESNPNANSAAKNIGGDYWRFSRDVNQQGNWWVGTSDFRPDWRQVPGSRIAEGATGALTSNNFIIDSNYIDFLIGGSVQANERVELWIRSTGTPADLGMLNASYDGIGVSEFQTGYSSITHVEGNWVLVRASSNTIFNDYMQRRVVWNIPGFVGRTARIRIADYPYSGVGTLSFPAHVNVDDIRCHNALPAGAVWLVKIVNGVFVQSNVGNSIKPVPIWGTTDSHAHVLSNLAFGGHLLWGDPQDSLATVYNCQNPLPDITDKNGVVVRAGTPPQSTPAQAIGCKMNADLLVALSAVAESACATLGSIPFVGPGLFIACESKVTDAASQLGSMSIFDTVTYHDATAPSSGGIAFGDWLSSLPFVPAVPGRIQGLIETIDWDLSDGTHSGHALGRLHNQYQADMVKRAWQGGLRMVGIDTINARAFQWGLDGKTTYDDWTAIHDMVDGVHRLVNCDPNSARWPIGALCGIAEIALTPGDLRAIVGRNHIALVLGVEVDELGKLRNPLDTIEQQVADLQAMGIRKVTMIHGLDNPLGGSGLFQDIYNDGSHWTNLAYDENNMQDGISVAAFGENTPFFVPEIIPPPFGGLLIGYETLGTKLITPDPCDQNSSGGDPDTNCVWNQPGWFRVAETMPNDWIGQYDDIQFRFGMLSASAPLEAFHYPGGPTDWFSIDTLGTDQTLGGYTGGIPIHNMKYSGGLKTFAKLNNLGWIVGDATSGPNSYCALEGMLLPTNPDVPLYMSNSYNIPKAHVNARGLSSAGQTFMNEMMGRGMIIDLDHFSQASRVNAYTLARDFGNQAYGVSGSTVVDYPLFGVHTDVRTFSKHGPVPDMKNLRDAFGFGTETDRTESELALEQVAGGTFSPGAGAALINPNNANVSTQVNNNCDFSSKSWALKYLELMKMMKGKGITPSTDFNGLAAVMAPRYGMNACHTIDRAALLKTDNMLDNWPRDWASNVKGNPVSLLCMYNTTLDGPQWQANCPSTMMLEKQYWEGSGVDYDDYTLAQTQPANAGNIKYMVARLAVQLRDDGAPRVQRNELVAVGASHQMAKMKKFKNTGAAVPFDVLNTGWDFNLDGLKHIGLYPDFFQDVRNSGVVWEQLTPAFNGAEDYAQMWERDCDLAQRVQSRNGSPVTACK